MRFCITLSCLFSMSLIVSCGSNDDDTFTPAFNSMTLKSVEVLRLTDQNSWDVNSKPDLFIRLAKPDSIITISDTIIDFDFETNGVIFLNEREITRSTNSFEFRLEDYDFDPSLPDDFQDNDRISRFTVFPWSEFTNISDQNTIEMRDSDSWIRLTVETR